MRARWQTIGVILGAAGLALASSCAPFGGSTSAGGGGGVGGDAISNGAGGAGVMSFSGCGVACDVHAPCTGHNMVCARAPTSDGGVCEPSTCPSCTNGKVCAFDSISCEPIGCSSEACGFVLVGACDDCIRADCCAVDKACASDPDCVSLNQCVSDCFSTACVTSCEQAAPASSLHTFNEASACNHGSCQEACFGDAGSSGG